MSHSHGRTVGTDTYHHDRRGTENTRDVHLIEEYARHLGHMDLLREAIDGRTGY